MCFVQQTGFQHFQKWGGGGEREKPFLIFRHQKADLKQLPYWRCTNFKRRRKKLFSITAWHLGFVQPCLYVL
jgi:hypothetical protein